VLCNVSTTLGSPSPSSPISWTRPSRNTASTIESCWPHAGFAPLCHLHWP
jgi:hypothetical protein